MGHVQSLERARREHPLGEVLDDDVSSGSRGSWLEIARGHVGHMVKNSEGSRGSHGKEQRGVTWVTCKVERARREDPLGEVLNYKVAVLRRIDEGVEGLLVPALGFRV
jgi:hypothetical protein